MMTPIRLDEERMIEAEWFCYNGLAIMIDGQDVVHITKLAGGTFEVEGLPSSNERIKVRMR